MARPFLIALSLVVITAAVPAAAAQYKRVHQKAIIQIANGETQEAMTGLREYIAKHPDDGESYYMLAVANSKLNRLDEAQRMMQQAIKFGVSPMRFVGGTQTELDVLRQTEAMQKMTAKLRTALVHGPMLGRMTGDSVSFWVRTVDEADVQIFVTRTHEDIGPVKSPVVRTTKAKDYTAVLTVKGLSPNTGHRYQVTIDGKPEIDPHTKRPVESRSFNTLQKTGLPGKFRFAFGGGAGFVPPHERMWTTIKSKKPDALMQMGDNIYSDSPEIPQNQHYSYYRRQSRPEYRDLVGSIPVYSIWDDHDFGKNDCSGGPAIDVPAWKRPVYGVYRNNWVNAYYGGGDKNPGIYFDFYIGDVHFIMIDGRYYRNLPGKTMLGPVQKQWLFDTLKKSKGTFKVLGSPVPWAEGAKGKSRDTWDGFPEERQEIYDFLHANRIEGVVQLSADRHRSDLWKNQRPGGYPIYEFNSSRLTNQHVHPVMRHAEFSYNKKQSAGLVDVDTTTADPTLTYRIINIDGEEVFNFTVKRSMTTYSR